MPTRTPTSSPNTRPSGEQRRLGMSYGFQVAKRSEAAAPSPGRQLRKRTPPAAAATGAARPGPEKGKRKKKTNPYAGASGPFSKKPRWTKRRRAAPWSASPEPAATIDVASSAVSVVDSEEGGPHTHVRPHGALVVVAK